MPQTQQEEFPPGSREVPPGSRPVPTPQQEPLPAGTPNIYNKPVEELSNLERAVLGLPPKEGTAEAIWRNIARTPLSKTIGIPSNPMWGPFGRGLFEESTVPVDLAAMLSGAGVAQKIPGIGRMVGPRTQQFLNTMLRTRGMMNVLGGVTWPERALGALEIFMPGATAPRRTAAATALPSPQAIEMGALGTGPTKYGLEITPENVQKAKNIAYQVAEDAEIPTISKMTDAEIIDYAVDKAPNMFNTSPVSKIPITDENYAKAVQVIEAMPSQPIGVSKMSPGEIIDLAVTKNPSAFITPGGPPVLFGQPLPAGPGALPQVVGKKGAVRNIPAAEELGMMNFTWDPVTKKAIPNQPLPRPGFTPPTATPEITAFGRPVSAAGLGEAIPGVIEPRAGKIPVSADPAYRMPSIFKKTAPVGAVPPTPPGGAPPPGGAATTGAAAVPPPPDTRPMGGLTRAQELDWRARVALEAFTYWKAMKASADLSGPLRQGLPMITYKEWWTSLDDMIKAFGWESSHAAIKKSILDHPNFQMRILPDGTPQESLAYRAGLQLTDIGQLTGKEEVLMSQWAEKTPGIGRLVKRSNRAYETFLNKLRSDTFNSMIKDAKNIGLNPEGDPELLKNIATYINSMTGRGSLGKAERIAPILNAAMFSPRLFARNVDMYAKALNPQTYMKAIAGTPQEKFIRRRYLRSIFSTLGAWAGMGALAEWSGLGDVNFTEDLSPLRPGLGGNYITTPFLPTNPDFGKIRIGNTRIDPPAGLQQFLLLVTRELAGKSTSSITGETRQLGESPIAQTEASLLENFLVNKATPLLSFAWKFARATQKERERMNFTAHATPESRLGILENELMKNATPMIIEDLYELSKEDPSLFQFLGLGSWATFGGTVQTYGGEGGRW